MRSDCLIVSQWEQWTLELLKTNGSLKGISEYSHENPSNNLIFNLSLCIDADHKVCGGWRWSCRKDLPAHLIHNQQIPLWICSHGNGVKGGGLWDRDSGGGGAVIEWL